MKGESERRGERKRRGKGGGRRKIERRKGKVGEERVKERGGEEGEGEEGRKGEGGGRRMSASGTHSVDKQGTLIWLLRLDFVLHYTRFYFSPHLQKLLPLQTESLSRKPPLTN